MKQVRIDVVENGYIVYTQLERHYLDNPSCVQVFNLFEDMVNFLSVELKREQEKE